MLRLVFFIIVMTVVLVFPSPEPVWAQDDLQAVEQTLSNSRAEIEVLKDKKGKVAREKKALKKKSIKTAKILQGLDDKVNTLDQEIDGLVVKKDDIAKRLKADNNMIMQFALRQYHIDQIPPFALLAQQEEGALQLARRQKLLGRIGSDIHDRSAVLRQDMQELSETVTQLSSQRLKVAILRKDAEEKRQELQGNLKQQDRLRRSLDKNLESQNREVLALTSKASSLRQLMTQVTPKSLPKPKYQSRAPKLNRPVPGRVVTAFGGRDKSGKTSQGDHIATANGAMITAPADGVVRFAGPFRSYKRIVILDHGAGYHALLAGLETIHASVGSNVLQGEPIGSMSTTNPKLYYELRHNGKSIRP